jgi:hypothetical protein
MNMLKPLASLLLLSVLAACGGGGGSSGASGFNPVTPDGPTAPGALVATKLVLALSATRLDNAGAGKVTATAITTSDGGQVVGAVPVSFAVDNNATFSVSGAKTDAGGTVSASISTGSDKSNRLVTVTAVSGTLTATASFVIEGAKMTGVPVPSDPKPGSAGNWVDFTLVDSNSTAIAGQAISVQAGSLPVVTGVTDAAGSFRYTYVAPATVGPFEIVATAGGVSIAQTVQVQSGGPNTTPPAVGPVRSASVSANPSVVSTNTATTSNRIEIRALFVGANNAPIKNVRVRFDLAGDAASVGGTFSTEGILVYSDANGIATTSYFPGSRSSPTDGVTVRACYGLTDFDSCATAPSSTSTTITVASDPLAVTIGSNEAVYTGPDDLTYLRKFVVLVVDASGAAKANVQIKPSIDIDRYYKGEYYKFGSWTTNPLDAKGVPLFPPPATCMNEDINRNGVLESGEDLNHNGSLEPRKSDVAISVVGSATTNAAGTAVVQIEYPKNIASWARVRILIAATGISGTEGRATWVEVLPVPASALTATGAPAFVVSPYGLVTTNQDGVLYADVPGGPLVSHNGVPACNNPN